MVLEVAPAASLSVNRHVAPDGRPVNSTVSPSDSVSLFGNPETTTSSPSTSTLQASVNSNGPSP